MRGWPVPGCTSHLDRVRSTCLGNEAQWLLFAATFRYRCACARPCFRSSSRCGGARLHGQGPDLQPQSLEPVPTQPSTPLPVAADAAAQRAGKRGRHRHQGQPQHFARQSAGEHRHPHRPAVRSGDFESDIRKLTAKNWFVHVHPLPRETRRRRRDHHAGSRRAPRRRIDPVPGQQEGEEDQAGQGSRPQKGRPAGYLRRARRPAQDRESYYQSKAFNDVKVSILEGNKPGDRGVAYLINEGVVQKFRQGRVRRQLAQHRARRPAEDDRASRARRCSGSSRDRSTARRSTRTSTSSLDYYRSFGFFNAHVGRDYEYNETEDRVVLTFYIDEGPRYQVRNISYIGNKVYGEEALNYNQKLKPGEYFDRNKMNNDIGMIKDSTAATATCLPTRCRSPTFELEPGVLDLVYQVNEGDQYRIGDIDIQIKGDNAHTRYHDRAQPALDPAGRHRRHPPVPLQRAPAESLGPVQHRPQQGRRCRRSSSRIAGLGRGHGQQQQEETAPAPPNARAIPIRSVAKAPTIALRPPSLRRLPSPRPRPAPPV